MTIKETTRVAGHDLTVDVIGAFSVADALALRADFTAVVQQLSHMRNAKLLDDDGVLRAISVGLSLEWIVSRDRLANSFDVSTGYVLTLARKRDSAEITIAGKTQFHVLSALTCGSFALDLAELTRTARVDTSVSRAAMECMRQPNAEQILVRAATEQTAKITGEHDRVLRATTRLGTSVDEYSDGVEKAVAALNSVAGSKVHLSGEERFVEPTRDEYKVQIAALDGRITTTDAAVFELTSTMREHTETIKMLRYVIAVLSVLYVIGMAVVIAAVSLGNINF